MTGSTLAALAASLLSLLFSYVPGFKTWYAPKDPYLKRLIMLALVVVAAMGAFSFACAGLADDFSVKVSCDAFGAWGLVRAVVVAAMGAFSFACAGLADDFSVKVSCDAFGAWGLVRAVIAAVAANQAVFLISPRKSYSRSDSLRSKPGTKPSINPGYKPGDKRSLRDNDNRK